MTSHRHARTHPWPHKSLATVMAGLLALGAGGDERWPVRALPVDDETARAVLEEERPRLASAELREIKAALDRIAKMQNEHFVAPLTKLLKHREQVVVVDAIDLLGRQPFEGSQKALLKLLRHPRHREDAGFMVHVVQALGGTGWSKRGFVDLREYFDEAPREVRRELLRAWAMQEEKAAFSLFVDHLDEPAPKSLHSASNPPASVWKARYEEWLYLRNDVRKGLVKIAGRSFENAAEAREWAQTREAREQGFEYKAGS